MISNLGKRQIKNYFGGQVGAIADTIAVGTGTTAPSTSDTALGNEVGRVRISLVSADIANNRIVFKGIFNPNVFGGTAGTVTITTVNEIGIFYAGSGSSGGTLIARTVLATPITFDATLPTEVEYSLGISV